MGLVLLHCQDDEIRLPSPGPTSNNKLMSLVLLHRQKMKENFHLQI